MVDIVLSEHLSTTIFYAVFAVPYCRLGVLSSTMTPTIHSTVVYTSVYMLSSGNNRTLYNGTPAHQQMLKHQRFSALRQNSLFQHMKTLTIHPSPSNKRRSQDTHLRTFHTNIIGHIKHMPTKHSQFGSNLYVNSHVSKTHQATF